MDAACPPEALLADYARNALPAAGALAIEAHVPDCATCLASLLTSLGHPFSADVPHCHVVREIGRGSAGVVYKAWWTKDHPRLVALKVLSGGGELAPSRFDREIAVLKRFDSPWIVHCLESGGSGNDRYFVMDFIHGEHLDAYLARPGLALEDRLAVFERVCRAVAHAHALGVVHRDLKPRNILVSADGQPHILDFGICSVSAADWSTGARATITHTGAILGTIKYMSPEQAWGGVAGPIDARSDIWSLGVMLHELLTGGQHPYLLSATPDKPAVEAVLERIRRELPRPARLAHLERGRDLEVLVERCLTREPEHRIQDAAQLADDLLRYRGGQPIVTRPHGALYRMRRLSTGVATRSRLPFWTGFVAATAAVWWLVAINFRVGWMVTGRQYSGGVSAAALSGAAEARDQLVVLGVTDETPGRVTVWAEQTGRAQVTPDMRTWRGVHGALLTRLVEAQPRAVIWDYWFRSIQPGDEELAAGINALEQADIPVVLACKEYAPDGAPILSRTLVDSLKAPPRYGAILARNMILRPGEFTLAYLTLEGRTIPSLYLAALASLLHPEARVEAEVAHHRGQADVLYRVAPGAYLRERDHVETIPAFKPDELPDVAAIACVRFDLDTPQGWESRTLPYEWALRADAEDMRSKLAGRIVVLGDLRRQVVGPAADRHPVQYGSTIIPDVPGCYLLADAVAGLLDRRYLKGAFHGAAAFFIVVPVLAMLGCAASIRLARWGGFDRTWVRRGQGALLSALSLGGLMLSVMSHQQAAVLSGMALFALAAPLAAALRVEFARNRYRILDRRRSAVEEPAGPRQDTLTWMPRPRTSR